MRRRKFRSPKKVFPLWLILIFVPIISIFLVFQVFRRWDGKSRFTIVIQNIDKDNKSEDYSLSIITLEPETKKSAFIHISPDFIIDIPYGYKLYPVYSVYKLGALDRDRGGGQLLKKAWKPRLVLKQTGICC